MSTKRCNQAFRWHRQRLPAGCPSYLWLTGDGAWSGARAGRTTSRSPARRAARRAARVGASPSHWMTLCSQCADTQGHHAAGRERGGQDRQARPRRRRGVRGRRPGIALVVQCLKGARFLSALGGGIMQGYLQALWGTFVSHVMITAERISFRWSIWRTALFAQRLASSSASASGEAACGQYSRQRRRATGLRTSAGPLQVVPSTRPA